ncbi:MAG: hypothetical protein VCC67_10750, partial [Myxococcota bacterium]
MNTPHETMQLRQIARTRDFDFRLDPAELIAIVDSLMVARRRHQRFASTCTTVKVTCGPSDRAV